MIILYLVFSVILIILLTARYKLHPFLALVRSSDMIELDLPNWKLARDVPDDEQAEKIVNWSPPEPTADRGYMKLCANLVHQANKGSDFDLLRGDSGSEVARDLH